MDLVALLTDPRTFFAERADDLSLLSPALVVVFLGILSAASTVPSIRATMAAMPEDVQGLGTIFLVIGAVVAFVLTVVFWGVYAGIFHAISSVAFGGEGGFTDTLAVTGWGFVPQLFSTAISAVVAYVVYTGIDFSVARDDPQAIQATIEQLQNDPLLVSATLVAIAITIWSGALWTFGLATVRDIEIREAALSVALVVIGSIAVSIWGLI